MNKPRLKLLTVKFLKLMSFKFLFQILIFLCLFSCSKAEPSFSVSEGEYKVILAAKPAKSIPLMKFIQKHRSLLLKEIDEILQEDPTVVFESVSKESAVELMSKLTEMGYESKMEKYQFLKPTKEKVEEQVNNSFKEHILDKEFDILEKKRTAKAIKLRISFGPDAAVMNPSDIIVHYTIEFDKAASMKAHIFKRNLDGSYTSKYCWSDLLGQGVEINVKGE